MRGADEISRFTTNGKTFFFNRQTAKNGSEYLGINALYGKGNQERLVLFQPHMVQFYIHYQKAMEEITGLSGGEVPKDPTPSKISRKCPDCDFDWGAYEVVIEAEDSWYIECTNCREIIFDVRGGQDD